MTSSASAEGRALEQLGGRSSRRPAGAEARPEQLGHQVVVVEDEARAAQLQRQRDQEQQVRRVAGLDDVERPLAVELPSASRSGARAPSPYSRR